MRALLKAAARTALAATPLLALALGAALPSATAAARKPAPAAAPAKAEPLVRLYVLDCGYIRSEPGVTQFFGVTIDEVGGNADMPVACYLIRHNDEWLLYDAGNGDWRHGLPSESFAGMTYDVPIKLVDQLKAIGIGPDDIRQVAISHFHLDHVGNLALFGKANILIQRKELDWALSEPSHFTPASAALRLTRPGVTVLDGDQDLFGDGSVVIQNTAGHTPGHQSLVVRLKNTGTVILTGDLYHYAAELKLHKVSAREANTGTPESRAKIEALAAREHAQIWIEHDLATFRALKKGPAFYD